VSSIRLASLLSSARLAKRANRLDAVWQHGFESWNAQF
jgi:hypothetical protein